MDVVFATGTLIAAHPRSGGAVHIDYGTHWLADDPVVRAYPSLFSDEPKFGLHSSEPLEADGYPAFAARPAEPEQRIIDAGVAPEAAIASVSKATPSAETTDATPGTRRTRTRSRGKAKTE